jgi:hypothetical protein
MHALEEMDSLHGKIESNGATGSDPVKVNVDAAGVTQSTWNSNTFSASAGAPYWAPSSIDPT